jgi:tetratricopeptide (TPR) repeat protein
MDEGHWKRARQAVDVLLRANPNDAATLCFASKVQASFGNLEKALAYAERAASIDSRNPVFLAQLAEIHGRLAGQVSLIKQVSYVRQLKKEVETAFSINSRHLDTMLVDIMFLSKAPLLAGGDRKRAHFLAEELVKVDPAWGHLIEARLAEQERNDAQIERALLKGADAKPLFYPTQFYLAKFYCCVSQSPRYDEAVRHARAAIRLDPTQSGAYDILARVYAHEQHWTDLDAVLAESELKVPDDLSPYFQAANMLFTQGQDFPRAERYLKKYLSQEPEGRQPTVSQSRELLAALNAKGLHKGQEAGF